MRKPSLWAHFTHCSSFEHNYLIIHPILIFNELSDHFARDLCYYTDKNEFISFEGIQFKISCLNSYALREGFRKSGHICIHDFHTCNLTAPDPVMDLDVEFLAQNTTRGIYIVTWTTPVPSNGSYYQQFEYSFSSAYTVGPQYNGSVTLTLSQAENQYNISDALYFTNYIFTITTINIEYSINNGPTEVVSQSLTAGTVCDATYL